MLHCALVAGAEELFRRGDQQRSAAHRAHVLRQVLGTGLSGKIHLSKGGGVRFIHGDLVGECAFYFIEYTLYYGFQECHAVDLIVLGSAADQHNTSSVCWIMCERAH